MKIAPVEQLTQRGLCCYFSSFRLQVSIFFIRIEAWTVAVMAEVAMANDQGAGITLVQVFEQIPHGLLLLCRARVVGLTAGIKSPFVADADGVGR